MESESYGQCRCCLVNGNHRNILKEYNFKGSKEIYYNIFMECFNLYLSVNTNVSMLICLSCIQRLRDAVDFRSTVVKSEQTLLTLTDGNQTLFVNVSEEHVEEGERRESKTEVKEEPNDDNSNDYEPEPEDASCDAAVNTSGDSKECLDELSAAEAALYARFPPRSVRRLPDRGSLGSLCYNYAMHLDTLKGRIILPKMIEKILEENLAKKTLLKVKTPSSVFMTEKTAQIHNATTLIQYSNVTPFKSKTRTGFPCFYCKSVYDNLDTLRKHQMEKHSKTEIRRCLTTLGAENFVVYVDVTDLKCAICNNQMISLIELKSHLTKVHSKKLYQNYTDRVIPFKFSNCKYECQCCGFAYETFGSIERHMNGHYRNYVCKECGTGFVTKCRLKVHVKSMHLGGTHPCEVCKKIFTSQQKYKNHFDTVHKLVKRFKCTKCPERFTEYFRRQKHLVEVHNVAPLIYKCNVCDRSFVRRYTLSRHMKRDHLEERDFQCELCPYRCFTKNELRVHMIKHNGERIYECAVCKKSYARKKTLKEHMRIHNNDRRFACAVCGQAFVQKCSLKGHIKTHHLEYSMQ